jgi:hypothetical protein
MAEDRQYCDDCGKEVVPADLHDFLRDNRDMFDKYWFCLEDVIEKYRKYNQ